MRAFSANSGRDAGIGRVVVRWRELVNRAFANSGKHTVLVVCPHIPLYHLCYTVPETFKHRKHSAHSGMLITSGNYSIRHILRPSSINENPNRVISNLGD